MALLPLPASYTQRYFIDYTTGRLAHSFVVRVADGIASSAVATRVANFLDLCSPLMGAAWQVTGVRVAASGSDVTLPTTLAGVSDFTGPSGAPSPDAKEEPRQLNFSGRSLVSGRKVRVGLFGLVFNTPASYRFGPSDLDGAVGDIVIALFSAGAAGVFTAIDGNGCNWYSYANVNYNSHWETAARG